MEEKKQSVYIIGRFGRMRGTYLKGTRILRCFLVRILLQCEEERSIRTALF